MSGFLSEVNAFLCTVVGEGAWGRAGGGGAGNFVGESRMPEALLTIEACCFRNIH